MSKSITTPFPSLWDASLVTALRSCGRKAELEYFQHWKPRAQNVHLHAGAAFAHGLEAARRAFHIDKLSDSEAVAVGLRALMEFYGDFTPPEGSAKTLDRMAGALEFYFDKYPLPTDPAQPILVGDKHGIEFSFAEPLPISHPETGEPLIWCGRADQVVSYAGGTYISDEKTTTSLGSSWARQWDLRSQFTGYCWAARRAGLRVDGVLVRGISILKTKYETAEAITYRPEWQIERWFNQTLEDINDCLAQWKRGAFRYNLDHACSEYGGCPFRQVCLAQDPQPFLDVAFERRQWNPLLRTETKL
jgi:hypothetical protein